MLVETTVKHLIQVAPWAKKLLITQMKLEHRLAALLLLHIHSQLNTWLQWVEQRQLQDETRIIWVLGFGVTYIRVLMVSETQFALVLFVMKVRRCILGHGLNSLCSCDTTCHHNLPSLGVIIGSGHHLFDVKPLPIPMLRYCQWAVTNELHQNFSPNRSIFFQELSLENVYKMPAILFRPYCVKCCWIGV